MADIKTVKEALEKELDCGVGVCEAYHGERIVFSFDNPTMDHVTFERLPFNALPNSMVTHEILNQVRPLYEPEEDDDDDDTCVGEYTSHNFEPRYSEKSSVPDSLETSNAPPREYVRILEAMRSIEKTYECDVCTRCGKVVNNG